MAICATTAGRPHVSLPTAASGMSRILYASQFADPVALGFMLEEFECHPAFEFICLIDRTC
jgi:hypothetical protein